MVLKSGKSLYTIHSLTKIGPINWKHLNELRICSIDMGRENFGLLIEDRIYRRKKLQVESKVIIKRQFQPAKTSGISYFYKQFNDLLDEVSHLLVDCDVVLIEKQLAVVGKGKGGNVKTYRDMQHLITYFMLFKFNKTCHIVEVSPRIKTKYLNCPANITGKKIKKWCSDKAEEFIEIADDEVGRDTFELLREQGDKTDEIGDVKCQSEAFMRVVAIDTKDDRFCLV